MGEEDREEGRGLRYVAYELERFHSNLAYELERFHPNPAYELERYHDSCTSQQALPSHQSPVLLCRTAG